MRFLSDGIKTELEKNILLPIITCIFNMWQTLIIHILKFVILSTGKQEWICYDVHIMRMATQNCTAQPTTLRPVSLILSLCWGTNRSHGCSDVHTPLASDYASLTTQQTHLKWHVIYVDTLRVIVKVDLKRNPIACTGGGREEKVNKIEGKKW